MFLFFLSVLLIAMENGLVIPTAVWWFFGIVTLDKLVTSIYNIIKEG
jgi:hypothetical protein